MENPKYVKAVDDKYESVQHAIDEIEKEQGLHLHRIVYYIEGGFVRVKEITMSTKVPTYVEKLKVE